MKALIIWKPGPRMIHAKLSYGRRSLAAALWLAEQEQLGMPVVMERTWLRLGLQRILAWPGADSLWLSHSSALRSARSPAPRSRPAGRRSPCHQLPFFLLLTAGTYYEMARHSSSSFARPLNRTDALYFTVAVFLTVGFGGISATSQTARLVVTGQIIADLVILGLGIKIIVGAVESRRAAGRRRHSRCRPARD